MRRVNDPVVCHVTLRGTPLCALPMDTAKELGNPTCGCKSLADGRRMVQRLQKLAWSLRVVRGDCPVSLEVDKALA